MGIFGYLILFLVIIAMTIVAGVYTIKAALAVAANHNYSGDANLKTAHKYLTIASTVCWISIALIITLIVLYMVFGLETVLYTGMWVSLLLLITAFALATTVGGLAAASAYYIKKSTKYGTSLHAAYYDSLIATGFGLGSAVVVIIGLVIYGIYAYKEGKKKAAEKAAVNQAQSLVIADALEKRKLSILQTRAEERKLAIGAKAKPAT